MPSRYGGTNCYLTFYDVAVKEDDKDGAEETKSTVEVIKTKLIKLKVCVYKNEGLCLCKLNRALTKSV